jgi:hypothetical protein
VDVLILAYDHLKTGTLHSYFSYDRFRIMSVKTSTDSVSAAVNGFRGRTTDDIYHDHVLVPSHHQSETREANITSRISGSEQTKPCVISDHRPFDLRFITCCTSIEASDDHSGIALEGKSHNLNPVDHGTWKDDENGDTRSSIRRSSIAMVKKH